MTGAAQQRVVVGVDGSEHSWRALTWALHEAKVRGVAVLVVHAFDYGIAGTDPSVGWPLDTFAKEAQQLLDRAVQHARDEGVETDGRLEFGSAAKALVRDSDGAALLVVGSRGRGGLTGALLGSVSTACVHHAACPVVIVPPPDRVRQARAGGE